MLFRSPAQKCSFLFFAGPPDRLSLRGQTCSPGQSRLGEEELIESPSTLCCFFFKKKDTKRVGRVPDCISPSAFQATELPLPPRAAERAATTAQGASAQRSTLARFSLTDPETGVAPGNTGAAICVQNVDVQCVLQFTLIHAAGCVLHRHTSRVIHRLELSFCPVCFSPGS